METSESTATAIFERLAWRCHRERAARSGSVEFLHAEIAERLVERLEAIGRSFYRVLDLGMHGGALLRLLAARSGAGQLVAVDPARGFAARQSGMRVVADPELIPFRDRSFDLIVSGLALHWVADLPGALIQLRRALKPDGLLLAAMFGGATLVELRTALIEAELIEEGGASPRVSPTVEFADAAALLQRAGLAMPVADMDTITVTYPDLLALMRDLRGMGETNALAARRRTPLRRATLARAAAIYRQRFGNGDGRVRATFEIVYLTGWAPDTSQPTPLRPGSARVRLADALGTVELSAGDTAAPERGSSDDA
jgi:NADH dehydrogenase [ubiquinone] 1 alpha subcomplex assembly factor 5